MTPEQEIIAYIKTVTGGLVALTPKHANIIVSIALRQDVPKVILFRYGIKAWEKVRTLATTQEAIDAAIKEAIKHRPVEGFYKYDCFNKDGQFEGTIYTVNPNLF